MSDRPRSLERVKGEICCHHQSKDTDFSTLAFITIVVEALGIADDSGSTDTALIRIENADGSQND